jgi:hypothetical protein
MPVTAACSPTWLRPVRRAAQQSAGVLRPRPLWQVLVVVTALKTLAQAS